MEKTLKHIDSNRFGFDQAISRENTHAEKYDLRNKLFGTDDVLPMWVADMDLPTPPFVVEALQKRLKHPILGYPHTPDSVYQAIIDWQAQYGLEVKKSEIVFTHNVANGFMMAVGAYTAPDDAVMLMPPVYPPFFDAISRHKCRTVEAPLVLQDNRYSIDFAALEAKIAQFHVKLLLFCHPQNPSGRVWTKQELTRLADICVKHHVIIISDEIHADLTFAPNQHIPLASLEHPIREQTITLSSPGKTFNLGGLQTGYALIANSKLKRTYLEYAKANAIYDLNLFGQVALEAAYSEQGKQWRDRLLQHFAENIAQLETFFKTHQPKIKVMEPEASFLVWLDFREVFDDHQTLKKWLIEDAKLGFNDGESFAGASQIGTGFMRMNIAVSKETLHQALTQLLSALPD
ncbi:MalY/PatB family protein [Thiomicrorhabdus sp. 6S3-12]|uniref:MalY/PatB family protein n=1 Tax=Thiomicrorhabdus sp. 6S3-12 TaxID=2819681 RepID=UPI001AACF737|nr:PatB family C-S lyase [Thiomicrorhabdus sp. 6S3-12]MBO1923424.1 PatB family C-S lyase [Thiomicrorhabdus sp. 6S3-12]